jgi:hypothetical protein
MRLPHKAPNSISRPEASDQSTVGRIRRVHHIGTATLEAVGFWTAVVLPLPTLLVLAFGSGTPTELVAVAGLLLTNLLAFVLGHDYSRTGPAS